MWQQATRAVRSRPTAALAGWALFLVLILSLSCAPLAAERAEGSFPDFVYRSEGSLRAYQVAVAIPELLGRMPCYCGCGQNPAYTSLRTCFLRPEGGFDSHGSNCPTCVDEALDVDRWHKEGKSPKAIRAAIEAKYARIGPGTPTPPVGD